LGDYYCLLKIMKKFSIIFGIIFAVIAFVSYSTVNAQGYATPGQSIAAVAATTPTSWWQNIIYWFRGRPKAVVPTSAATNDDANDTPTNVIPPPNTSVPPIPVTNAQPVDSTQPREINQPASYQGSNAGNMGGGDLIPRSDTGVSNSDAGNTGSTVGTCGQFTSYLGVGNTGPNVTALQQLLVKNGFSIGNDTYGTFGEGTKAAVGRYQTSIGIGSTGFAGPLTIAAMNRAACGGNTTATTGGGNAIHWIGTNATLLTSSTDKAGAWNNFGPGAGNINKDPADWNWLVRISSNEVKSIKRITLIHNSSGEVWSTGYSRYLADGTDLYGYNEHPYPLVVEPGVDSSFKDSATTAYDQLSVSHTISIGPNQYNTLRLYGQKESTTFTGGTLVIEFTDGTSARTTISATASSAPIVPASDASIAILSPNGGESYSVGQEVVVRWKTIGLPQNVDTLLDIQDDRIPGWQTRSFFGSVPALNYSKLISSNGSENIYEYRFTVPSNFNDSLPAQYKNIFGGQHYKIDVNALVSGTAGTASQRIVEDRSDVAFTLGAAYSSPTPTPVSSPAPLSINGSSVVRAAPGDAITLYTTGTQNDQTYYIYLVGSGFSNTVNLTPLSSGAFTLKVPVEPAGTVQLYLRGYKGSTLISQSQSAASLTITESAASPSYSAPFVLSAPPAGQTWLQGNSYAIEYYGGNDVDHLKIDFVNSTTGETMNVRSDVAPMPKIESTIFFEVPSTLRPGTYTVRITKLATNQVVGISPAVTVAAPTAGVGVVIQSANYPAVYKAGDSVPIFISNSNYPAGTTFDVKLATRALVVGSAIVPGITLKSGISGTANQTFNWQVPTSLSPANNYLILVCPSTGTECGHSLVFTVISSTPTASPTPAGTVSEGQRGAVANILYSIGDIADRIF
jgi:hypothetical protein